MEVIRDVRECVVVFVDGIVVLCMIEVVLFGEFDVFVEFDWVVCEFVVKDFVIWLKVWDLGGRVVYADDVCLIGCTFEIDREVLEVVA